MTPEEMMMYREIGLAMRVHGKDALSSEELETYRQLLTKRTSVVPKRDCRAVYHLDSFKWAWEGQRRDLRD